MKRSKFTESQIVFALKQAESGVAVAEVCRKLGISETTFYSWKKKFSGLGPDEPRRLRQLEEENARLKQIVADLTLDFSRPGKPTDNPFIESFKGGFRDQCLNVNWFLSLEDAKEKIQLFKEEYNGFRPHSSLSGLTPNEVVQQHSDGPIFSILGR